MRLRKQINGIKANIEVAVVNVQVKHERQSDQSICNINL